MRDRRTSPVAIAAGSAAVVANVLALLLDTDVLVGVAGALAAVAVVALVAGRRVARPAPDDDVVELPPAVERLPARPVVPLIVDVAGSADDPGWRDEETGLYGATFLAATLDARLAIARRTLRPLALVLFEVVEPPPADPTAPAEATDPVAVRSALTATLREADLACRSADGGFAIVLEDTTEDGAVWTTERVRRNLAAANRHRLFRAGVASYPSHGLEVGELTVKASTALASARDWRRDRIEVAQS